jgi:hypothetical protein
MAPFGSSGVLGDAHASTLAHDPYGTLALGATSDQTHASSVFGHPPQRI